MRTTRKSGPDISLAYIQRVNLAIDYIVSHLFEPLRLDEVARVAHLSPFHFHRVFQSVVGLTITDFVKRLRLEKALHLMAHSRKTSLTQIAVSSGFASSSDFSRCFKQRFGVPPSVFNINQWRSDHLTELTKTLPETARTNHINHLPGRSNPDHFKVRIRELPARTVAYIRVPNPYQGDAVPKATDRLIAWARNHSFAERQWLGYQWDNPEVTALKDCHYYVAVEAEKFVSKGEIGRYRFPPMVVAQVEIKGGLDLELRALQWLYGSWLPRSGFVPDDQPGFESWIGPPFAHGMDYFELHVQLPVKPG